MRYLILFCTLSALSTHAVGQSVTVQSEVDKRVEAIRQRELADPKKARLWEHADSYKRLVQLRVMQELGILQTDKSDAGNEPLFVDTVVNVSNTSSSQDETTISINRKNKQLIIAGANDNGMYSSGMPVYRTTNGGKNWARPSGSSNRVKAPEGYVPLGDPIIVCDNDGNFYYSFLSFFSNSSEYLTNISVARSKDGITWDTCVNVIEYEEYFEDKEMIVTDNSPKSQWYGRVYLIWNRFAGTDRSLTLAWSDDKGLTWNLQPEIEFETSFPVVRIGPNGEVIVGCSITGESVDVPNHALFVSTDGGSTFKNVLRIEYDDLPGNLEGRPSLKGDYGPRVYPFTNFDIDHKTGAIHFVSGSWNGAACQLNYRYSNDMGTTWSEPQIIGIAKPSSSDVEKDRFFPSVTVDQITGEVFVLYYSSEHDPDNTLTGVLRQKLSPTLTAHQRPVSKLTFDPRKIDKDPSGIAFIGDYIGSDAFDSVYAASWTANKAPRNDGEVYVYVANTVQPDSLTSSVSPTIIHASQPVISWITPNPAKSNRISVSYYTPKASEILAELFTIEGKLITKLYAGTAEAGASVFDLQVPTVANGSYFLKITSPHGIAERQLILFR